ncbi:hypothetical protein SAMN05880574_106135 [Chryseobacterium sp. RU37D]|uniref:hypothetical protein n=1 Tax=Chryseobacterium sp. RU37D TaxID=1907397 RepID=UPI0009549677|nr:hypothetical protein [Chryseobacterium sp. RU37D]SIQ15247.1 hypothetical protein SAMN05880574_106135 [Chryseobacterium sp. RU37D]
MDKVTLQRIEKLHPSVREEIKQIIKAYDEALTGKAKIRITQGCKALKSRKNFIPSEESRKVSWRILSKMPRDKENYAIL